MNKIIYEDGALLYISRLSDGHLRDALTMLDKCLAYSKDLTIDNVVKALGVANYDVMIELTDDILVTDTREATIGSILRQINDIYMSGIDIKQFIKQYMQFIIDVNKYRIVGNFKYLSIPETTEIKKWFDKLDNISIKDESIDITLISLLDLLININTEIKWDSNPKSYIEAKLILFIEQKERL